KQFRGDPAFDEDLQIAVLRMRVADGWFLFEVEAMDMAVRAEPGPEYREVGDRSEQGGPQFQSNLLRLDLAVAAGEGRKSRSDRVGSGEGKRPKDRDDRESHGDEPRLAGPDEECHSDRCEKQGRARGEDAAARGRQRRPQHRESECKASEKKQDVARG